MVSPKLSKKKNKTTFLVQNACNAWMCVSRATNEVFLSCFYSTSLDSIDQGTKLHRPDISNKSPFRFIL